MERVLKIQNTVPRLEKCRNKIVLKQTEDFYGKFEINLTVVVKSEKMTYPSRKHFNGKVDIWHKDYNTAKGFSSEKLPSAVFKYTVSKLFLRGTCIWHIHLVKSA